MALYSPDVYERNHAKWSKVQCSNGGRKRVQTAIRNHLGLLCSKTGTVRLPDGYVHGRAGGLARHKKVSKNE